MLRVLFHVHLAYLCLDISHWLLPDPRLPRFTWLVGLFCHFTLSLMLHLWSPPQGISVRLVTGFLHFSINKHLHFNSPTDVHLVTPMDLKLQSLIVTATPSSRIYLVTLAVWLSMYNSGLHTPSHLTVHLLSCLSLGHRDLMASHIHYPCSTWAQWLCCWAQHRRPLWSRRRQEFLQCCFDRGCCTQQLTFTFTSK